MPIATDKGFQAVCDNPKCPGPPRGVVADAPEGWLVIYNGPYNGVLSQLVTCSNACAAALFADAAAAPVDAPPVGAIASAP